MKKRRFGSEGEQNVALTEMYITRREMQQNRVARDEDFCSSSSDDKSFYAPHPSKKTKGIHCHSAVDTFSTSSSSVAWKDASKLTPIKSVDRNLFAGGLLRAFNSAVKTRDNELKNRSDVLSDSLKPVAISDSSSHDVASQSFQLCPPHELASYSLQLCAENSLKQGSECKNSKDGFVATTSARNSDIVVERSDMVSTEKRRRSSRILSRINESELNNRAFSR